MGWLWTGFIRSDFTAVSPVTRVTVGQTVYALDSTTIGLCLSLFPWARFRSTKAAVKLHTLLDLRGPNPTMIAISDGKRADVSVLDQLLPEPGAFYVMYRGYVDFERLKYFTLASAFFVTRTNEELRVARSGNRSTLQTTLARRTALQIVLCAGSAHFPAGAAGGTWLMNWFAQAMKYFMFERSSWPPSC
jgi:hypothetical protein